MPDMRNGERNQRGVAGDNVGPLNLGMPRQRADFDKFVLLGDAVETLDPIDVDQQGRRRKAHVEGCDQALPTREHPRIVLVLGQKRDGFLKRPHLFVCKWRRFHLSSPLLARCFARGFSGLRATFFLIVTGNADRSMRATCRSIQAVMRLTISIARRSSVSEASGVRNAACADSVTFSSFASG